MIETSPGNAVKNQAEDVRPSALPRPSLWRPMALGALLIPLNVWWTTCVEVRWYSLDGTSLPLFITPVFILFLLTLSNLFVRRLTRSASPIGTTPMKDVADRRSAKRPAGAKNAAARLLSPLQQHELLLVYMMLVVSCAMAGQDTFQNLFGFIGHAYWFGNPSNNWQKLFFQYLPSWLVVTDKDALAGYYQGNVSIYGSTGGHYLVSWIVPLAVWGLFFLTLVGMYLCIVVLIRRQWIESEKLTFPIVQLPIAMTADDAGTVFFKNPRMWLGFGLAASIAFFNGLHMLYPSVPQFNVKLYDLQGMVVTEPWKSIGSTQISFYPFAIGLAYFMPVNLSFSCWFFFLFSRVLKIAGSAYGLNDPSGAGYPGLGQQATGAWVGIGIMLLYSARGYLAEVWRSAWSPKSAVDPKEARQYRGALIGLAAGVVALGVFSRLAGLSPVAALIFFGMVFLLAFVITRVRAEFGAPHEIVWVSAMDVPVSILGTHQLGPQNCTILAIMHWFNRGYRNHPMPNMLEGFKMMEGRREVTFGRIIGVYALALTISLLATYWANLHITYAAGAASKATGFKSWAGGETFGVLQSWLTAGVRPASTRLHFMLFGLVFAVFLSMMRSRFYWWPLHPAGYALAFSYAMDYFWMPMFIAWLCKSLILRWGGSRVYQAACPFFLGLILGDYTMGAIWAIIGPLTGVETYRIYL